MISVLIGTVTGGRLNLRAAADSSSAVLLQIPNGSLLCVASHNDTWYSVTYGNTSGFVMKEFIVLMDLSQATEHTGTVAGGALNLRSAAATTATRLAQIPNATELTVIDFDVASDWYITTYGGYTGYVMKAYVTIAQTVSGWRYGQVNANELNVRREPSTSADRWNNVWPRNRIVLVKDAVDGWYESIYRGQPAYVAKEFITLLDTPVHSSIVDRMMFMVTPELGRDDVAYFNGYSGEWCHRFADWLTMNAGMPMDMIPNHSNCGAGMVWFLNNLKSGGFYFKNAAHKARFISNYEAVNYLDPELTTAEEAYVPSPGDYIYFRWNNAANSVNVSHVGIVETVSESSLTTWEGNSGDKVVNRTFALNDAQIVGYGKPDYAAVTQL